MTRKGITNIAASHRAKLLNLSREGGDDFQFLVGRGSPSGSSTASRLPLTGTALF